MKIKRYTGNNTQEAMLKVKMDMGNDAIILHTRNIKQKGLFRMFSKPMVEILAAIDDEYVTRRPADAGRTLARSPKLAQPKNQGMGEAEENPNNIQPSKQYNGQMNEIQHKVNRLEAMISKIYENSQSTGPGTARAPFNNPQRNTSAQSETAAAVQRPAVFSQAPAVVQRAAESAPRAAVSVQKGETRRPAENSSRTVDGPAVSDPRALEPLLRNLENQEVLKEILAEIAKKVKEKFSEITQNNPGQGGTQIDAVRLLIQDLADLIGIPMPIKLRSDGKPTVALFLGPTGVGKTTTIAKIAANYALNKNKRVALITADTYRIAAVDQLKTYAEILSLPVTVVYSADEMGAAIEDNDSADLILIDTAGISHKRKQQLEEMKSVIESCGADEIYLVMSATASWKNCLDVIKNHQFIKDYKLIFTKLDEAPTMGLILNARYFSNKSLSYVTTGQSVPDDIDLVNVDKLTKNLLRSTAQ